MEKSILIYGVGRSGTTTLYNTVQSILQANYEKTVRFIYEPFLWSPEVFDKHSSQFTDEFSYMTSTSIYGMYANKVIPMLIRDNPQQLLERLDKTIHSYLKDICTCHGDRPVQLTKLIRANGRIALFDYLNPDAKHIFIIRNPIDVINSSINMFSFYGTDFHASDYQRFHDEVIAIYGQYASEFPLADRIQQEAFYWYFANLHFLNYAKNKPHILPIVYEDYVSDINTHIKAICHFIDTEPPPDINESAARKVGPVTKKTNLSDKDFESLLFYFEKYKSLIAEFFPASSTNHEETIQRYQGNLLAEPVDTPYRGRSPLYIQNQLKKSKEIVNAGK